jgi:hypothetical protein
VPTANGSTNRQSRRPAPRTANPARPVACAGLAAALDDQFYAVLGQVDVDGKTNEVSQFAPLLEHLDLTGHIVTAYTLHTRRGHAEFLVTKQNAHYIFIIEHASHSSCCLSWRVKESSLAVSPT